MLKKYFPIIALATMLIIGLTSCGFVSFPKVEITSPEDGAIVHTSPVLVKGTVSNYDGDSVIMTVNGHNGVVEVVDGQFSKEVYLVEGVETTIRVTAPAEPNDAFDEITITYEEE